MFLSLFDYATCQLASGTMLQLQGHDGERYRPPIPPQSVHEMKARCKREVTMPKSRDGGGIGGQVFADVLFRVSVSRIAKWRTTNTTKFEPRIINSSATTAFLCECRATFSAKCVVRWIVCAALVTSFSISLS